MHLNLCWPYFQTLK